MKTLKTDDTSETPDLFNDKECGASPASSARNLPDSPSAVTLKGSVFTLPVIKLSTVKLEEIRSGLEDRLASALEFFRDAPVVIDLSEIALEKIDFNFGDLSALLQNFRLVCVAVQNGSEDQHKLAIASGLAVLTGKIKVHPKYPQVPDTQESSPVAGTDESSNGKETQTEKSDSALPALDGATRVVNHPIRSGQRIYAKGGDLILLAAVNAGAEIMADGNIHIYGPLRGRALAGVNGNTEARIFCHSLEAELVAIAGGYRVFEDNIPVDIYKKSVQIHLDGEQLKITAIDK